MEYTNRTVRNTIIKNMENMALSQKRIGELVGLSQQMVGKILKNLEANLPLSTKQTGAKRRLSKDQLRGLEVLLKKGSEFHGFEGAYWTYARVQSVIDKEFEVKYSTKQVGRILTLIGWTRQKPQKKEAKQDIVKVEKWVKEELPALKKSER